MSYRHFRENVAVKYLASIYRCLRWKSAIFSGNNCTVLWWQFRENMADQYSLSFIRGIAGNHLGKVCGNGAKTLL